MRQSAHDIRPIGQAIRDAQRALDAAEWARDDTTASRERTALASLKSQQARGEQFAVPF